MTVEQQQKEQIDNALKDVNQVLSWAEKTLLQKLDAGKLHDQLNTKAEDAEVRKAATEYWNSKIFTIWGTNRSLPYIVNHYETSTKTVDGVRIEDNTELAALIQIYILAHWWTISTNSNWAITNEALWIDGVIWSWTKKWIDSVKDKETPTVTTPTNTETVNNSNEVPRADIWELVYWKVWPFLTRYKEAEYNLIKQDSAWLREAWKLQIMNDSMVKWEKITIKYTSAKTNKTESVEVDASKCKTERWDQYSANKFWKAIEDAISQKERNLWNDQLRRQAEEKENNENDSIKEWIRKFDENTISKEFIKDYLTNIKYVNDDGQMFTIKNSRDWKEKRIHRNALLAGGKFSETKFRQRLEALYEQDAKDFNVKSWIDDFNETRDITNNVVKWYFKAKWLNITCSKVWIAEITVTDNLGKSNPLLRQDIVWNDGLFNKQNYKNKLVKLYENDAIKHYKTIFETRENKIKSTIITDIDSAKQYSELCDGIINDINERNSENYKELNDIKTRVTQLKQNAENDKSRFEQEEKDNKEYEEFKKQMDKDLGTIKSKTEKRFSAIEMQQAKEDCLNLLRKYINITPVSGKYDTYKQESLKNEANKFIKVGKKQEYLNKVKDMKQYIEAFGVHFQY